MLKDREGAGGRQGIRGNVSELKIERFARNPAQGKFINIFIVLREVYREIQKHNLQKT